MREVDDWIGRTDNTPPPQRVRLRVIDRQGGRCAITGRDFRPGDEIHLDHIIPLACGGRNAEDNLQAVIAEAHREKTAEDVALKAKIARVRAKHLGLAKPKRVMAGSRASRLKKHLDGSVSRRW